MLRRWCSFEQVSPLVTAHAGNEILKVTPSVRHHCCRDGTKMAVPVKETFMRQEFREVFHFSVPFSFLWVLFCHFSVRVRRIGGWQGVWLGGWY